MTEQKPMSLEQGIALQLYMESLGSEYRPMPGPDSYTDMDMEAFEEGPWYRKQDGGYGDWFQEIYMPHHRNRRRDDVHPARNGTLTWTNDPRQFTVVRTPAEPEGINPDMPRVQRYRLITPTAALVMRMYKKEAREIIQELFKD